jgi:hypothetical protein
MRRWWSVLLIMSAGCLWKGYEEVLSVHLDVLTQTASKLVAVAGSPRGLSAESMAEYVYPAKRGRTFLVQFQSYEKRQSYVQFGAFLDRYEALVNQADAARAHRQDWAEVLPALETQRDALLEKAAAIRQEARRGN